MKTKNKILSMLIAVSVVIAGGVFLKVRAAPVGYPDITLSGEYAILVGDAPTGSHGETFDRAYNAIQFPVQAPGWGDNLETTFTINNNSDGAFDNFNYIVNECVGMDESDIALFNFNFDSPFNPGDSISIENNSGRLMSVRVTGGSTDNGHCSYIVRDDETEIGRFGIYVTTYPSEGYFTISSDGLFGNVRQKDITSNDAFYARLVMPDVVERHLSSQSVTFHNPTDEDIVVTQDPAQFYNESPFYIPFANPDAPDSSNTISAHGSVTFNFNLKHTAPVYWNIFDINEQNGIKFMVKGSSYVLEVNPSAMVFSRTLISNQSGIIIKTTNPDEGFVHAMIGTGEGFSAVQKALSDYSLSAENSEGFLVSYDLYLCHLTPSGVCYSEYVWEGDPLEVQIPLGSYAGYQNLRIGYIDRGWGVEFLDAEVIDVDGQKYIRFVVDHFSDYAIYGEVSTGKSRSIDVPDTGINNPLKVVTSNAGSTNNTGDTGVVDTSIVTAVLGIMLTAGVGFTVYKIRKLYRQKR